MIESRQIRQALENLSDGDRQFQELARWAAEAGDIDEDTCCVYAAPAYLEQRLRAARGVGDLLDDFDLLAADARHGEDFRLVGNAVRLAAEVLGRDPGQLAVQLLARLPGRTQGFVGMLRQNLKAEYPRALLPVQTTFIRAEHAFLVAPISDQKLVDLCSARSAPFVAALDAGSRVFLMRLAVNRLTVVAKIECPDASVLDFTASGEHLIVGSREGTISIISTTSRTVVRRCRQPRTVRSLICLDEDRLAIEHDEGVSIFSFADGRELVLVGKEEGADCMIPKFWDAPRNALITGDFDGNVDAWDAQSGRLIRRIGWFGPRKEGWTSRAEAFLQVFTRSKMWVDGPDPHSINFEEALSSVPDGKPGLRRAMREMLHDDPHRHAVTCALVAGERCVAGSINGELSLWNVGGARIGQLEGHTRGFLSAALAADGETLVTTGDGSIRVWNLADMLPLGSLPKRGRGPDTVACPPGSPVVLGACEDGSILSWDLRTSLIPAAATGGSALVGLAPAERQSCLYGIASDGRIEEWDIETGIKVRLVAPALEGAAMARLSAMGSRAVIPVRGTIRVVEVATGLPMFEATGEDFGRISSIVVSEDGEHVVCASASEPLAAMLAFQGRLELVIMPTGERVVLDGHSGWVDHLELSSTGRYLLVNENKKLTEHHRRIVSLWDLETRTRVPLPTLAGDCPLRGATFRADGETLLWHDHEAVYQWRVGEPDGIGEVLKTAEHWERMVITPDDRFAAVILDNTRLELWDLSRGERLTRVDMDYPPTSCALVPERETLLTADAQKGVNLFRFPFFGAGDSNCPATPSARWPPLIRPDSLAGTLGATAELDRSGKAGEAVARWQALALAPQTPVILQIGLAQFLHASGRTECARQIMGVMLRQGEWEKRPRALALLQEWDAREEIFTFLDYPFAEATALDPRLLSLLSAGARWLASLPATDRLAQLSGTAPRPASRLIAAQCLAQVDENAAACSLQALASDPMLPTGLKTIALLSLRAVMPLTKWLAFLTGDAVFDHLPPDVRRRLSREIMRARGSAVAIHDLLSPLPDDLPPIAPMRTPMELSQESVGTCARGDFDGALAAIDEAIRRRPRSSRHYHTRGMIHVGAGRTRRDRRQFPGHTIDPGEYHFERAVEDFSRAIEIDRHHEKAWSQRGYAYLELERWELALHDISEAIRLDGSDPANLRNRAYCLRQLNRLDEAARDEEALAFLETESEREPADTTPVEAGRPRVGDDPPRPEDGSAESREAARRTIEKLGCLEELRVGYAGVLRAVDASQTLRMDAAFGLQELGAASELVAVGADGDASVESRLAAACYLLGGPEEAAALAVLAEIAADSSQSLDSRVMASDLFSERAPAEAVVAFLRRLPDIDQTRRPPPLGTMLVPRLLRALLPKERAGELIHGLACDRNASPALREIAAEGVATYYDPAEGRRLLEKLAAEVGSDRPLGQFIQSILARLAERDRVDPEASRLSEEQMAADEFVAARTADEIAVLAEKHRIYFDPEFVEQVASWRPQVPERELALFDAKLARLRGLPPNHELIGLRMFMRANSAEAVKAAVERYPFLSLPDYQTRIRRTIDTTTAPEQRPAMERRLAWLRALPVDPWQEALEAFVGAETAEELRAAVERHPHLRQSAFATLAERAFGQQPDWDKLKSRLERWKVLIRDDAGEQLLAAAKEALTAERWEEVIATVEKLPDGGDFQRYGRWLRALACISLGREAEGIGFLNERIAEHPTAEAYSARGRAFFQLRQYREARADYSEALKLDPDSHDCWMRRGICNANLHLCEESIHDLTQAERLDPNDNVLHTLRGGMFLITGRKDLAKNDFRTAIALFPDLAHPRISLARLLLEEDHKAEALDVLSDPRIQASDEETSQIRQLQKQCGQTPAPGAGPADWDRAFDLLMRARDEVELMNAVEREPLLSNPGFIDEIERHCRQQYGGEDAREGQHRVDALRRIVFHPSQLAFDAVMNATGEENLRGAVSQHPLLRDPAFLRYLNEMAGEMRPQSAQDHLRASIAQIQAMTETGK